MLNQSLNVFAVDPLHFLNMCCGIRSNRLSRARLGLVQACLIRSESHVFLPALYTHLCIDSDLSSNQSNQVLPPDQALAEKLTERSMRWLPTGSLPAVNPTQTYHVSIKKKSYCSSWTRRCLVTLQKLVRLMKAQQSRDKFCMQPLH